MDPQNAAKGDARRADLDVIRGVAIGLVVFFHTAERSPDALNHWYTLLKSDVYLFHMSLFMFVSGYLTKMSIARRCRPLTWHNGLSLACRKATKLLAIHVTMAIVALAAYTGVQLIRGHVPDMSRLLANLGHLVAAPMAEFPGARLRQLWFVQALAVLTVFGVLGVRALGRHLWMLLCICIAVQLVPLTDTKVLSLHLVLYHAPLFVAGLLAAQSEKRYVAFIRSSGMVFVIPFVITLVLWPSVSPVCKHVVLHRLTALTASFLAIPSLHWLALSLRKTEPWATLGDASLVIYLVHPFILVPMRALSQRLGVWGSSTFAPCIVAMAVCALSLPVLLKGMLARLATTAHWRR